MFTVTTAEIIKKECGLILELRMRKKRSERVGEQLMNAEGPVT